MKTPFKIILRGLLKNKKYLFFSVSGLFVSYAFFLLLFTYVRSELTYDRSIPGYENIYRVTTKVIENGRTVKETAKSQLPLGEALKAQIPGVIECARLLDEETLFRYGEAKFNRQKTYWVDETFPEIFSIETTEGNAKEGLSKPFAGLISEEVSKKFFGNDSPIGKVMIENEGLNMEIGGVFKKPVGKSHFDYDYLMSFKTVLFYNQFQNNWDTDMFYTYIKLDSNADLDQVKQKLAAFAATTYVNYHKKNQQVELHLQPFASIHMGSHLDNELSVNNNYSFVLILSVLGLFTLLVSLLNFSGMVTSRYGANKTSMLMNRIFGSRKILIGTITLEIAFLQAIAFLLAFLFTYVAGNQLFNMLEVPVSIFTLQTAPLLIGVLLVPSVLFCSLLTAVLVLRTQAKLASSGKAKPLHKSGRQQSTLVIVQYSFSIFLIIFLVASLKQVHFLKNSNPGYNKEMILGIHTPRTLIMNPDRITKGNLFFDQIIKAGLAESGSITSDLPGKPVHTDMGGFFWLTPTNSPELKVPADWISLDTGYFQTLNIQLLAGKNFEGERVANREKIILNEKASKAMGFKKPEDAIGSVIIGNSSTLGPEGKRAFTVIAVAPNFHQEGLQEDIKPLAFTYNYNYLFGCCALKLTNANPDYLKAIQNTWETIFPDDPFDYFFLEDRFNQQYKNEVLFFRLCMVFGLIAALIACYGLFGISAETILRRRKEIGIRKVNGATIFEIMGILLGTYGRWIIFSFAIAAPIAWFATNKWLDTFAYRTELSWWIFPLSGLIALLVALLTVILQSWRAATRNPVESLRCE